MKNVTIALDDETHRNARIRAAELGTSLSALVKDYLTRLANEGDTPAMVREMPLGYTSPLPQSQPPASPAGGPPYIVNGKKVWTKDGKPRQPGALRGMWVADDFDEWPEGFIEAMYGEETDKNWYE
tara:strand:- start:87205 stop:87582 length:378 start_codon:yes stop_codon:yes gene_type:complete